MLKIGQISEKKFQYSQDWLFLNSSIRSVIYYIAKCVAANLPLSGGFPVFSLTLFTGYTVPTLTYICLKMACTIVSIEEPFAVALLINNSLNVQPQCGSTNREQTKTEEDLRKLRGAARLS